MSGLLGDIKFIRRTVSGKYLVRVGVSLGKFFYLKLSPKAASELFHVHDDSKPLAEALKERVAAFKKGSITMHMHAEWEEHHDDVTHHDFKKPDKERDEHAHDENHKAA